ncbi:MAG: 30S ribosomal protein S13 [Candidatus Diapherotrites archaeon]|nr:30S ribosomal protein S13 [Candidatus Diapherotrites archaeon]
MAEQKENIRYIVRIAGKDLDGTLSIERSTRAIRGINHRMAKNMSIAFEKKSGIVPSTKMGDLTEEQSKVLEDVILNPQNYGLPLWSFNRQKDYESGKSIHRLQTNWSFQKDRISRG